MDALVAIKRTMARLNRAQGLPPAKASAIERACDDVLAREVGLEQFPLSLWQTGSGTQTNMNVNEVLANRASELLGGRKGDKGVHPNDDVNRGQSSNDTFASAMHVATVLQHRRRLRPGLDALVRELERKEGQFAAVIKVGRTHTQDATPVTLGQEFSGYASSLRHNRARVEAALGGVKLLPQGGTAVGTGLNSYAGFDADFCAALNAHFAARAEGPGPGFAPMPNKFEGLATNDALTAYHAALAVLASSLHKIANDIRFLASGPRSGLGELELPANEPGSSIMPGKVNPTQCEALTMVCAQAMANNQAVLFANANGHFELNVYRPMVIGNVLQSQRLLGDAAASFAAKCVAGIRANEARIREQLANSLMLVTALNPVIGYDRAAAIAKLAHRKGLSLRQAALELGALSAEEFDRAVRPEAMLGPRPGK